MFDFFFKALIMITLLVQNVRTVMSNLTKMVLHLYFGTIFGLHYVVIIFGTINTEQLSFVRNLDILQEYILVYQFLKSIQLTHLPLEGVYQMTNGHVVVEVKIISLKERS